MNHETKGEENKQVLKGFHLEHATWFHEIKREDLKEDCRSDIAEILLHREEELVRKLEEHIWPISKGQLVDHGACELHNKTIKSIINIIKNK